jgi:type I restriction enzyme, R subunit
MTQLREEIYFTRGRVIVRGKTVKRGEAKKADHLLFYKSGIPIAVIEAKDNNQAVGAGMQQALEYAEKGRRNNETIRLGQLCHDRLL